MKIGPKYKIAKRLGAAVFEKTQTQKFALSEARRKHVRRRPANASDYKRQLIEKQKMRFSYGITERQLRKYVNESLAKSHQPVTLLMNRLESRLDNVIYRLGLAKTRRFARQMVSHGHITINSKRQNVPSHQVRVGDVISVREGSKNTGLFVTLKDDHTPTAIPGWLSFDVKKMTGEVKAIPTYNASETLFDPQLVFEYYSR